MKEHEAKADVGECFTGKEGCTISHMKGVFTTKYSNRFVLKNTVTEAKVGLQVSLNTKYIANYVCRVTLAKKHNQCIYNISMSQQARHYFVLISSLCCYGELNPYQTDTG